MALLVSVIVRSEFDESTYDFKVESFCLHNVSLFRPVPIYQFLLEFSQICGNLEVGGKSIAGKRAMLFSPIAQRFVFPRNGGVA